MPIILSQKYLVVCYVSRKFMHSRIDNECADPEISVRRVLIFFGHRHISQGHTDLLREAIGSQGSNCLSRGVLPEFVRKPIVTLDFSGMGVWTPCPLSGSAHVMSLVCTSKQGYFTS